jgi:DeoR/GlpR family transcriptional regulator of sugar metabolism
LHEKKELNIATAAKKLNTTERTVQRDLAALAKAKWLSISGATRSRSYQLTSQALKYLEKKKAN